MHPVSGAVPAVEPAGPDDRYQGIAAGELGIEVLEKVGTGMLSMSVNTDSSP
jgi:hypothetical protein